MLTADEIAGMRTTVDSALPDTATITRRVTPTGTLDPGTGELTVAASTALWSGQCRVRSRVRHMHVEVGDAHAALGLYDVTVPADATGFAVDDFVTVTASTTSTDLIGAPLQILDIQLGTWDLGRRLVVQTIHTP